VHGGLVRLHREHVIPTSAGDRGGGVGVGVHRIEGHHRPVQIDLSQQCSHRKYFVALRINAHLPEHRTGTRVERGEQVRRASTFPAP
jgi:hypothetical protein